MIRRKRFQRRFTYFTILLGFLLLVAIVVFNYHAIVAHMITRAALSSCKDVRLQNSNAAEAAQKEMVTKYGSRFRQGFIDRGHLLDEFIRAGLEPEVWPPFLVLSGYFMSRPELERDTELFFQELETWIDPTVQRPLVREFLVDFLVGDYGALEGWRDQSGFIKFTRQEMGSLMKLGVCQILFARRQEISPRMPDPLEYEDEPARWRQHFKQRLQSEHWSTLVRELEHPREKVRAGAMLLLLHHPDQQLFKQLAIKALEDPSRLVRLAAAGTLALEEDGRGVTELLAGLGHPRWEIRWWSGACLAVLGQPLHILSVAIAAEFETDAWVKDEYEEIIRDSDVMKSLKKIEKVHRRLYELLRRAVGFPESPANEDAK